MPSGVPLAGYRKTRRTLKDKTIIDQIRERRGASFKVIDAALSGGGNRKNKKRRVTTVELTAARWIIAFLADIEKPRAKKGEGIEEILKGIGGDGDAVERADN